jgi:hypothetical protein
LAAKKGNKYKCEECGLVVLVEDSCGCDACDVICCGAPMKPVQVSKAKPKAKPKTKPKNKK